MTERDKEDKGLNINTESLTALAAGFAAGFHLTSTLMYKLTSNPIYIEPMDATSSLSIGLTSLGLMMYFGIKAYEIEQDANQERRNRTGTN